MHDVWQIDGLERALIGTGERVCSLTISEIKSGSLLKYTFFEYACLRDVPLAQIHEFFECLFQQWGLPGVIQVDNGYPWKSGNKEMPTLLTLWWIGLGIKVHFNRVHCPQENAWVENHNGLITRWLEVEKAPNIQTLNEQSTWLHKIQIAQLRVRKFNNTTRIQAFPQLYQVIRAFKPEMFNFRHCEQYISENFIFRRKVHKKGQFEFEAKRTAIGKEYALTTVDIKYDISLKQFSIWDENKQCIKQLKLEYFEDNYLKQIFIFKKYEILKSNIINIQNSA